MPDTSDYENLLQLPNVIGVEWDPDREQVIVFVTAKVPEAELPDEAIVSHAVEDTTDSDVIEAGIPRLHDADQDDPLDIRASNPRQHHRPVTSGLSEGPVTRRMAGTGGPLAQVTDPSHEYWADTVETGDVVRLSNCHVYADARPRARMFGDSISQPARLDGGETDNHVGDLAGYIPMLDNMYVDVAARTASRTEDVNGGNGLPSEWPTGVRRDYSGLSGTTLTKTGRTTHVTRATVHATSATIRVQIDDTRVSTFRDQLVVGPLSSPGDSGSGVYDQDGRLTGLLFAGSDQITLCNKIAAVEEHFGVEVLAEPFPGDGPADEPTDEPTPDDPGEDPAGDPDSPIEAEGKIYTLTVDSRMPYGTLEYSFAIEEGAPIEYVGNSSSLVGNRLNGWVAGWDNEYVIGGPIVDTSFPEDTKIFLNGEEVPVDEVIERTHALTAPSDGPDPESEPEE